MVFLMTAVQKMVHGLDMVATSITQTCSQQHADLRNLEYMLLLQNTMLVPLDISKCYKIIKIKLKMFWVLRKAIT